MKRRIPPQSRHFAWMIGAETNDARDGPHDEVALMLWECLLHSMVEEGILAKEEAMAAIAAVGARITEPPASENTDDAEPESAAALVAGIAQRFIARYRR